MRSKGGAAAHEKAGSAEKFTKPGSLAGLVRSGRSLCEQEAIRAAAEMAKDQHLDGNARDITVAIREGDKSIATIRLSLKIEESD
jgi:type IV secretory pathway TrbL component